MGASISIAGNVSAYALPEEWSDEELRYWFVPETAPGDDGLMRVVRPARFGNEQMEQRVLHRSKNIVTQAGLGAILNNLGVIQQGSVNSENGLWPFAQILTIGSGPYPFGSLLPGQGIPRTGYNITSELGRKVPAAFNIVGFTTTILVNFGASDAVGTWTQLGFYGVATPLGGIFINATLTPATGSLYTWAPFSLVKGSSPVCVQYSFTLSNPTGH